LVTISPTISRYLALKLSSLWYVSSSRRKGALLDPRVELMVMVQIGKGDVGSRF
jgi:hypothetical protein